jgi:photosystem II stability/assembly factor-like uncharacterized protein
MNAPMLRTALVAGAVLTSATLQAGPGLDPRFVDISFRVSEFQPNVPWEGRINAIAVSPVDDDELIVATDSGGAFKSTDRGQHWAHLAELPVWPMQVVTYLRRSPAVVLATSKKDFKTVNGGGIWRSADGGATWEKPPTSVPPASSKCDARPSAYGIAIEPLSHRIFVATDCGVSISDNDGATWRHVEIPYLRDPFDATQPTFTAVEALGGGRVVLGGYTGVWISSDAGSVWRAASTGIGPVTSIHGFARSPLFPTQVYAISDAAQAFLSEDSGGTWRALDGVPVPVAGCGGIPFIKAVRAPLSGFFPRTRGLELYLGNSCSPFRLPVPRDIFTGRLRHGRVWDLLNVDHLDARDMAFTADERPAYLASDGGFHATDDRGNTWRVRGGGPDGLNALQVTEVTGQSIVAARRQDLYFGTQDNSLWSSADAGRTWPGSSCCEGFSIQVERRVPVETDSHVTHVACSWTCETLLSDANFRNERQWPDPVQYFGTPILVRRRTYVEHSPRTATAPQGLQITTDLGARWRQFANFPEEFRDNPRVSWSGSEPVLYQPYRASTDAVADVVKLARITNFTAGMGTVTYPSLTNFGGLGVVQTMFAQYWGLAVDPSDPMHLIAPDVRTGAVKESWDGGETWAEMPALTDLVTRGGALRFADAFVPVVSSISFHPENAYFVLAGGLEGGIYFSNDRGATWRHVPGSEPVTSIISFYWQSDNTVIVSTYGRGLWKLTIDIRSRLQLFEPLCEQPCLLVDPRTLVIREFDGQADFDRAMLIFNGRAMDAAVVQGQLKDLVVTPGSSVVLFSELPADTLPFREDSQLGSFAGLEAAAKLIAQGYVVRGVTFQDGMVKDVLASTREAALAGPGAQVEFKDTGSPTSGVEKRPYIALSGDLVVGGVSVLRAGQVLNVEGERFEAADAATVQVHIDGQPVGKAVRVRKDGTFRARLRFGLALAKGPHRLEVVQQGEGQTLLTDASTFYFRHVDVEDRVAKEKLLLDETLDVP